MHGDERVRARSDCMSAQSHRAIVEGATPIQPTNVKIRARDGYSRARFISLTETSVSL
jgi:hypothetical protein